MDWSNELYVRLYTRDTADWKVLPWQSRALLPLMMRKLDRAGVLETRYGARGVAVLVDLPLDVVEAGVAGLLEDGCIREHDRGFVMVNFLPAQEATKSDKLRSKESRDRRRASAMDSSVTDCDATVTVRDASVTAGHDASRGVTLSLAELNRAEEKRGGRRAAAVALASGAIEHLNGKRGSKYKPSAKATAQDFAALAAEGVTLEQAVLVIDAKVAEWAKDDKMARNLRPSCLFRPSNFRRYLADAEGEVGAAPSPTAATPYTEEVGYV